MLSEQLSRGKLPPKAKFRADDEISIGEPATPRAAATNFSAASGRLNGNGLLGSPDVPVASLAADAGQSKTDAVARPLADVVSPPQPSVDKQPANDLKRKPVVTAAAVPGSSGPGRVNSSPVSAGQAAVLSRSLLASATVAKSASLDNYYR